MQKKSARSFLKKYHKTLIIFCFLYVLTIGVALVASSYQASTWQAFKLVSGINSQVSSQMPSSTAPASSSNAPVSSSSQVLTPPDTAYQSICPQLVVPKVEEYQAPQTKNRLPYV